jgi:hypothetical protein
MRAPWQAAIIATVMQERQIVVRMKNDKPAMSIAERVVLRRL